GRPAHRPAIVRHAARVLLQVRQRARPCHPGDALHRHRPRRPRRRRQRLHLRGARGARARPAGARPAGDVHRSRGRMTTADRADAARTAAVVLAAAVVIAMVRGPLFDVNKRVRERSDVYALPPPRQLVALSLGYRSALADVLWAHLLVSQGLHTEQHRRYGNLIRLLDAINTLEPTYRDPYRFAESLITFQSSKT